jgi:WS/DGAT/MGAT family acyltransferase
VGHALGSLSRQPVAAAKAARRTVEAALTLRHRNRQPGVTPPPAFFTAPRTSLNGSISPHRRVAFAEVSLDEVKMVKNALGGTVNDVVLALCAGSLRRYLNRRGELPGQPLVAMVPISVRTEAERGTMGNRVSSMLTSLATHLDDPVARLATVRDSTRQAKEQEQVIGAAALTDWAEFAAPAVAARAARLLSNMRVFDRVRPLYNVTISNVPGPPFPLYSAGARLVAMYPLGPITDGVALNITVMSYLGSMCFGLVACREAVPDIWDLAHGVEEALDELKKAADHTDATPKTAAPKAPRPRRPRQPS